MSLYAPASTTAAVRLRPATLDDAPMLARWDREPHVIACSSDDPEAEVAFGGIEWREELAAQDGTSFYRIAEANGRPIGVMQICDPHLEPTHYWGEIEPGLRAIDIWIGPSEALGRGYGTEMMTLALDACFAAPEVHGVVIDPLASNTDAHRFYQRLGFEPEGRRMFDEDDCLVMRLTRERWKTRRIEPVIPDAAQRRSGTAVPSSPSRQADQPGQRAGVGASGGASPGSPLAGRPGASDDSGVRPGSSLHFGRDDKDGAET